MKIENLRKDDLGRISLYFPLKGEKQLPFTYPEYCIKAFYLTCQGLEQLESSASTIQQGNTIHQSIGLWFIGVEAYINTILRASCYLCEGDFNKIKKKDLDCRLNSIFDLLNLEKKVFHKSGLLPKINEFRTFRNEFFHDRTYENELQFHKTVFASIPFQANQVDAMQAAVIALDIFNVFRNVFTGLDLMPDIYIQKDQTFGFVKYDIVYEKLLKPFFKKCLLKHRLETGLDMEPLSLILQSSEKIKEREISVIIKHSQEDEYKWPANSEETTIGNSLLKDVADNIETNSETFQVPRYQKS